MKKWWKYCLMIVFLFPFLPIVQAGSQDTHITRKMIPKVFSNVVIQGRTYWSQMGYLYANGILAYCIEPEVGLSEFIYDSYLDFGIEGLTPIQKEQMELIATYGYQYSGHQSDRYYMATQELLWETIGYQEVYFTTGAGMQGLRIDVSAEKNEIMRLIQMDWKKPSFDESTVIVSMGSEISLVDQNAVLSSYQIEKQTGVNASIEGNVLKVTGLTVGNGEVVMKKKGKTGQHSFVYRKTGSQTLASLSLSSILQSKVHFEVKGGKIRIQKVDRDTNESVPSGSASLKGAIYEVKDERGNIVDHIKTDENGIGESKMLALGEYTVQEKTPSIGYLVDPQIYTVLLSKQVGESIVVVKSKEQVITNQIEFMKVYNEGESGTLLPEEGITFEIYNQSEELVKTVVTDRTGYVSFQLPYGSYIVKQKNTSPYYEKIDDFEIHVYEEKNEPIRYVLSDALVKAKLRVVKIDADTKEKIKMAGISFKIKNAETGEYIKQRVTYQNEGEIDVFETDENGEFTTPEPLEGGKYILEEIHAPDGYLLGAPISFTIDQEYLIDGEVIELIVENRRPKGRLQIEKTGENISYEKTLGGIKTRYEKIPLPQVTYEVTTKQDIIYQNQQFKSGQVFLELVTGEEGVAISDLLPLGTYCVKEKSVPEGYQIDLKEYCGTLKFQDDKTPEVTFKFSFHNEKVKRKRYFQKLKEQFVGIINQEAVYQNISMEGIEFGLYNKDTLILDNLSVEPDTKLETIVTDEKGIGMIELPLPNGAYYLKELSEVEPYIKDERKYEFTIDNTTKQEEDVLETPIINRVKKGILELTKRDYETSQILRGAEITLAYEDGTEIAIDLSMGELTLRQMPYGTYRLKEIKAPQYYQKKEDFISYELQSEIGNVTIYNKRIVIPKASDTMKYTQVTIFTLFIFGILLVVGSRWVARRRGLY